MALGLAMPAAGQPQLPPVSQWCNFEAVARSALTGANSTANALRREDAPAHGWYRFVLSFPPHLVREYAARFGLDETSTLLDPFCGTGTTLVEAKKLRLASVGIEALPMAHFAAHTKVDWSPDPDGLVAHSELVAKKALARIESDGITDAPMTKAPPGVRLRSLAPEAFRLLVKNSISPLPLHKVLILIEAIQDESAPAFTGHERLALASLLPTGIGNLRFGPEVGVGKLKADALVVSAWLDRVRRMAEDIRLLAAGDGTPSTVHHGDARAIDSRLKSGSIDAVITSPPYPNEKDYTRTVRLESVILGLLNDKMELRKTKKQLVRSNTRGVYVIDDDDLWVPYDSEVHAIADNIESRRQELRKNSGFERMYHRVTRLYFGGMARHLHSLSRVLKPGARLAYVVGDQASYLRVMIRTGNLLADVARTAGYEVDGIDLFRTRMATATRKQLREEVLLLRWPKR